MNDGQLSPYIEQTLSTSRSVYKRVQDACEDVDTMAVIPECAVGNAGAVADCADRAARCRACQLLLEADRRLDIDCDAFDNGLSDVSCAL